MLPFMKWQSNVFISHVDEKNNIITGSLQDFINEIENKIVDLDEFEHWLNYPVNKENKVVKVLEVNIKNFRWDYQTQKSLILNFCIIIV
jgi:hypothetical protein